MPPVTTTNMAFDNRAAASRYLCRPDRTFVILSELAPNRELNTGSPSFLAIVYDGTLTCGPLEPIVSTIDVSFGVIFVLTPKADLARLRLTSR
jgi:hypothetical protein